MSQRSRVKKWGQILALSLVPLAFVYVHIRAHLLFAPLELGMRRPAVIRVLGEPTRIESQQIFCAEYFPWTGECPDASRNGEFLFFKFGIDRWIVVGIDADEAVWFLTMGDT